MNYENRQWILIKIVQNVSFLPYFFIFCRFAGISIQSLPWRHLDSRLWVAGITSWISDVIPAHRQSLKPGFAASSNHKLTTQDKVNISDQKYTREFHRHISILSVYLHKFKKLLVNQNFIPDSRYQNQYFPKIWLQVIVVSCFYRYNFLGGGNEYNKS